MDEIKQLLQPKFIWESIKNPRKALDLSIVRYLIVGFTTFFLDFGLHFFLKHQYGFAENIATRWSTLISMSFNFVASNFWSFPSVSGRHGKKLLRYLMVACVNFVFYNLMFELLVTRWEINDGFAKVMITAMIVCWNYLLYKFWVFKGDDAEAVADTK